MANMVVDRGHPHTHKGRSAGIHSLTLTYWPTWWWGTGHPHTRQRGSAGIRTQCNPNIVANVVVGGEGHPHTRQSRVSRYNKQLNPNITVCEYLVAV